MRNQNVVKMESGRFIIGEIVYDELEQCLSTEKNTVFIRYKLSELLSYLVNNSQAVVTRDELIENIWDGNYCTGTNAITHCICKLRKLFSDIGANNVMIRTIPKRGYSLIVR